MTRDDFEFGLKIRKRLEVMAQNDVDEGATPDEIIDIREFFPVYVQERLHQKDHVETDPMTRQPYVCLIEYDGAVQIDWTLKTPSMWKPFHGTTKATALPFIAPTGAHDIYKIGEMAVFEDGTIQKAVIDTNYSPEEYPAAWEVVE